MLWLRRPERESLSVQKALDLATIYLEQAKAYRTKDPSLALEICLDAESALYRIQRSDLKLLISALTSGTDNANTALCKEITTTLNNICEQFDNLGRPDHSKRTYKNAKKLGFVQQGNPALAKTSNNPTTRNVVIILKELFSHEDVRIISEYKLPQPDARLEDVHQLLHCFELLHTTPIPKPDLSSQERQWSAAMSDDPLEQERFHNLASGVVALFIRDGIKAEATTVAEVVALGPVLGRDQYRALLEALIDGVNHSIILQTHLLEGLAQLMQHAPPGHLNSDDLVNILNVLSSRLQGVHGQANDHIYQLCVAVSRVLDAMVDNQVMGLRREQLHEPLLAYLKELKDSSDPHLAYHAAYAFQALLYIPDDETKMQAMLRRTSALFRGVFGVVSAVKAFDLNDFMDELANIQKQLPSVTDVVDISLRMYKGVTSVHASGEAFKQSMEEGLTFSRKTAWYPALRGADAFLHSGELTKFKTLVCDAPCRQELAFQWGICQRLGQIAANPQLIKEARQDAVYFLEEIYKNNKDWGDHAEIKQWIINILKELTSVASNDLQG
ncbi:hypothetical protein BX616_008700 [Lobosporangium transversale]|nr:hypothetical protein BX616_008700 [Lobosporangium transversale]